MQTNTIGENQFITASDACLPILTSLILVFGYFPEMRLPLSDQMSDDALSISNMHRISYDSSIRTRTTLILGNCTYFVRARFHGGRVIV